MTRLLFALAGILAGWLAWGAWELAGEKLRGRPGLKGEVAEYRVAGLVFLVLCIVFWRAA